MVYLSFTADIPHHHCPMLRQDLFMDEEWLDEVGPELDRYDSGRHILKFLQS